MSHSTDVGVRDDAAVLRRRARTTTTATPDQVYALVSDLPRSPVWSPECTGGRWVAGEPGQVGAIFRGENRRRPEVASWGPVARGDWSTEAEVVAAVPRRTFRWAMCDSRGCAQESVWGFDIRTSAGRTVVEQHFRMGSPTERMRETLSGMTEAEKERFLADWGAKVEADLAESVERVKHALESDGDTSSPRSSA